MIRQPSGEVVSIAGLGHWPASIPPDLFMTRFGGEMPEGIHLTVVPAAMAAQAAEAAAAREASEARSQVFTA